MQCPTCEAFACPRLNRTAAGLPHRWPKDQQVSARVVPHASDYDRSARDLIPNTHSSWVSSLWDVDPPLKSCHSFKFPEHPLTLLCLLQYFGESTLLSVSSPPVFHLGPRQIVIALGKRAPNEIPLVFKLFRSLLLVNLKAAFACSYPLQYSL
jgi:hypothetical protein